MVFPPQSDPETEADRTPRESLLACMTANREPSNQSFEIDREATVCNCKPSLLYAIGRCPLHGRHATGPPEIATLQVPSIRQRGILRGVTEGFTKKCMHDARQISQPLQTSSLKLPVGLRRPSFFPLCSPATRRHQFYDLRGLRL
jgi:hypothetical protein